MEIYKIICYNNLQTYIKVSQLYAFLFLYYVLWILSTDYTDGNSLY